MKAVRVETRAGDEELVHHELLGLAKLNGGLLQITEGPLDETLQLFVVDEEVVPEGLLGEHLRIPQQHHPVFCTRQRHVEPTWVVEKPDSLLLVASDAR